MPANSRLRRSCAVVALGMLFLAIGASAQDFSELPSLVTPGDSLAVLAVGGEEVQGRLVAMTRDSLTLDIGGSRVTIAARTTARIHKRDSTRNGMWVGAIAGGAIGVASGALLYAICANETGNCGGTVPLVAGLGAGAGALIGGGLDGLRHKTVFSGRPDLRFQNEATSEMFGNLAWGRVDSHGSANATPQMGAGWGAHFTNGLGVEFDVVRSAGQSRQTVSCVKLEYDENSPCLGEGAHSLQSVTIASAKLSYAFMRDARVQPFVTGGAGWATYRQTRSVAHQPNSRTFGTYDPTKPVLISDVTGFGHDGLVGTFGGGVRVPLSRSLALRTEVTVYPLTTAAQAGMIRGSVGLGYRW
jgi:hypothetical protein